MEKLIHKDIVFPEVDLSHDESDPEWEGKDMVPVDDGKYYRWIRPPHIYANSWNYTQEIWDDIVREYESNPDDFYNSWQYLDNHPMYWTFKQGPWGDDERAPNHYCRLTREKGIVRCVDIDVVRVNPDNETIEDDEALNTATRVWYETGHHDLLPREDGCSSQWHDWKMDGGAETMEAAIIELAYKVWKKYGNDRRVADNPSKEEDNEPESSDEASGGTDG